MTGKDLLYYFNAGRRREVSGCGAGLQDLSSSQRVGGPGDKIARVSCRSPRLAMQQSLLD